jgi:hypothetical protein
MFKPMDASSKQIFLSNNCILIDNYKDELAFSLYEKSFNNKLIKKYKVVSFIKDRYQNTLLIKNIKVIPNPISSLKDIQEVIFEEVVKKIILLAELGSFSKIKITTVNPVILEAFYNQNFILTQEYSHVSGSFTVNN